MLGLVPITNEMEVAMALYDSPRDPRYDPDDPLAQSYHQYDSAGLLPILIVATIVFIAFALLFFSRPMPHVVSDTNTGPPTVEALPTPTPTPAPAPAPAREPRPTQVPIR